MSEPTENLDPLADICDKPEQDKLKQTQSNDYIKAISKVALI